MINIYIEAKNDKTPEANFIHAILKNCFTNEMCKNIKVICVNGKDNLPNVTPQFKEKTIVGGKNLVIFDADGQNNGGGFEKRKTELLKKEKELNIAFELFLFPNNQDDGCFETLLGNLIVDEHKHIMDCFDKFENCLQSKKDAAGKQKYVLPNIKSRYFTYISSMQLSKKERDSISYKWKFADPHYWNLQHEALQPLKSFLEEHCISI